MGLCNLYEFLYKQICARKHPCESKLYHLFFDVNLAVVGIVMFSLAVAPLANHVLVCEELDHSGHSEYGQSVHDADDMSVVVQSQNDSLYCCCADGVPSPDHIKMFGKKVTCQELTNKHLRDDQSVIIKWYFIVTVILGLQFIIFLRTHVMFNECPVKELKIHLENANTRPDGASFDTACSDTASWFHNKDYDIECYVKILRIHEYIVFMLPSVEIFISYILFYYYAGTHGNLDWIYAESYKDFYPLLFPKYMACELCRENKVLHCVFPVNYVYDVILTVLWSWFFILGALGILCLCFTFRRMRFSSRKKIFYARANVDKRFIGHVLTETELSDYLKQLTPAAVFILTIACSMPLRRAVERFIYFLVRGRRSVTFASKESLTSTPASTPTSTPTLEGSVRYDASTGRVTLRDSTIRSREHSESSSYTSLM